MGLHLHPDSVLAGAREFVREHDGVAFVWQAADDFEVWFGAAGSFALHETLLGSHGNISEWMNVREYSPFLLFDHCMALHSEIRLQDRGSTVRLQKAKTQRRFLTRDNWISRIPLECQSIRQRKCGSIRLRP